MRKVIIAAGGAIAALGVSVGVAAPAFASGGTAPDCIKRSVVNRGGTDGWYAFVTNRCGKTMHVKVLGSAPRQASACHTLAPGGSFRHDEERFGHYSKTVVC
jgi:hypothetical protein